ncbi:MAG TPA: acyl carrier protein [Ideonella sp.]|nr:acyl carrier protein [Ideonella sp.]
MITSENIRAVIQDIVLGFDASALKDDQTFRDAGIDSLDFINILFAIDERHGTHIPDEHVKQCNSIQAILDYVNNPVHAD